MPRVDELPLNGGSNLYRQHPMVLGELVQVLAEQGWLERPSDASLAVFPQGVLLIGMLIAQNGQSQLALRETAEFGPAAGQALAPMLPVGVCALLDRLSRSPRQSECGFFLVALLCNSAGVPLRKQSLRTAIQR